MKNVLKLFFVAFFACTAMACSKDAEEPAPKDVSWNDVTKKIGEAETQRVKVNQKINAKL